MRFLNRQVNYASTGGKLVESENLFYELSSPRMLPGGVPSALSFAQAPYITLGRGGRCWDQSGKVYIDFICGYGPVILGHGQTDVNAAVIEQLERGILFPANSPLHDELNAKLKQLFPYSDEALFFKTGSEAVAAAIRLARAFTGKMKVIRCGFHGWHDTMASPSISWHLYEADPQPPRLIAGIPAASSQDVLSWNGEDFKQLVDLCNANRSEVAALIVDPIQIREPIEENLKQLRVFTLKQEILLILDEIKTGFRVSIGGVQQLYGVQADLTILSKAIANGFPLAVVLGRKEIVSLAPSLRIMGTYNNELASVAAALMTISILERPGVIPWLWEAGQQLIDGFNEILNRKQLIDDVCARAYRWPCLPALWYRQRSEKAKRLMPILHRELASRGVLMLANHPNFICVEHTHDDIGDALQIFEDSLSDCLKPGIG
jgi:glutamate-1-semialdehyde aminotransferase